MNRLSTEQRTKVIAALVEGNSIRATVRMTGTSKNTISKLLVEIGHACEAFHDATVRDLTCRSIQVDEIWAFCHSKEKNVAPEHVGELGYGDMWTFTAIDSDTKIVPTWLVGERTRWWAGAFMHDLAGRLAEPTQLTTDGHGMYPPAVWDAFGIDVDYAQLIKHYDADTEGEKRYSPAVCTGTEIRRIIGDPKYDAVSTSHVERQNLTMRMSMRRFTRLTNAFSKKLENLECAVALHFVHYNFCRKHQTLKGQTPAMAAGLTDHVWSVGDLVALLERENVSAATS